MTTDQLDTFHECLLAELRAVVTDTVAEATPPDDGLVSTGRRRRFTGLSIAAAAAAGAVGMVAVQNGPAAPPAYAVTGRAGSTVEVTVNRAEDATGLQKALTDKGIRSDITYLPWGRACADGRFADADTSGREGILGVGSGGDHYSVTIPAGFLEPGETFVLALAARPDGRAFMGQVGIATGRVQPCRQVAAPPLPELPGVPRG